MAARCKCCFSNWRSQQLSRCFRECFTCGLERFYALYYVQHLIIVSAAISIHVRSPSPFGTKGAHVTKRALRVVVALKVRKAFLSALIPSTITSPHKWFRIVCGREARTSHPVLEWSAAACRQDHKIARRS